MAKRKLIRSSRTPRTASAEYLEEATGSQTPLAYQTNPMNQPRSGLLANKKVLSVVILLVALGALGWVNKGWFVAATVNGKPIWRSDVTKVLTARYGKQTLESLIAQSLIEDEAKKAGVAIAQADIDKKEQEMVKNFGGNVKLEDLLAYQGMTKGDFDQQIKLQLSVQKILGKDIQITDKDVNMYIASNRAMLTATDPAILQEQARQALMDAKIGEKVQTWFTNLKNKAKILKFL